MVDWVRGLGLHHVIFETDSKLLVDDFSSPKLNISEFSTLVDQCRYLLLHLDDFSMVFSCRETNMVTHTLAHSSISFPSANVWFSSPNFMLRHLVKDSNGLINT